MNYFEEIDAWLSAVLPPTEEEDEEDVWLMRVKKEIKAKILESYRNGQKAGHSPAAKNDRARDDKPRRVWPPRRRDGHQ
jgi:hypothetical protein